MVLSTILTKSFSKDTALLILRVITGTVLIHHGYEKLANIENFADAFVRPLHLPFPIFLSYIAAFSEIGGSWLLIIGLATRFGAIAIVGTISVAIYHALVTAGFNIFLLELLLLYFASSIAIALTGPGDFSIDEVIIRVLRSEDKEEIEPTVTNKFSSKQSDIKDETSKGGLFAFLQANILSDTSS
tara:strand:+ start:145 stop:702 length:558 start_codon:yes stop_codon:yes gene_type:complete